MNYFYGINKIYFFDLLQVKAMVEGRDRRPELGMKLALELKAKANADAIVLES